MIVLISAFIPKNVNIDFLKNLSRLEKNMNVTLDSELYIQILKLYYQFEYGKSNKSNSERDRQTLLMPHRARPRPHRTPKTEPVENKAQLLASGVGLPLVQVPKEAALWRSKCQPDRAAPKEY